MHIKTLFIALLVTLSGYAQDITNANLKKAEELAALEVTENGNELILNDSISLKKGGLIKINLPYSRRDFMYVEKKKSKFGSIAKQAAGVASAGAFAVALGTNSSGAFEGAAEVMNKAGAISSGADALERIDDLPISSKAKKIAGQEMEILGWERDQGLHIIIAKFKKKKYEITLEAAYVTQEILL